MIKSLAIIAASITCIVTPFAVNAESLPAQECSQWECVCGCQVERARGGLEGLENPETGKPFFYPGGTKRECPGHDGSACIGNTFSGGIEMRGELAGCEWTLTPSDDAACSIEDAGAYDEIGGAAIDFRG